MDQILEENKNMIYAIAGYFKNYNSREDLFQVGVMGLIKAYNKYNPDMGVKFSTYAYTYILGEMKKLVREDKGIKISREIGSVNFKIEQARSYLEQQLNREPTIYEISSFIDKDIYTVNEALISNNCLQSFDYIINDSDDGKDMSLYDIIGSSMDIDMILELKEQLELLDPLERKIILARYMNDLTQKQTADMLGMNQVQVSRREKSVLLKMRNNMVNV